MSLRVLIIDDDSRLPELLRTFLQQHDVDVTHAPDGNSGLSALQQGAFDAVILDVMMPGINGLEVVKRIRAKSSIPVVMLTARGDETDRIVGLELGADDYVAKPFSPRELLARLRAVTRRLRPDVMTEQLSIDNLNIHVSSREVFLNDVPVEFTGIEFDILLALMRRAGRVVPREALLSEAGRGDVVVHERTVDVHISHLRQKLNDTEGKRIKTVRGVGYVFSKGD
jgi:two-component system, OmpR family, response regulator